MLRYGPMLKLVSVEKNADGTISHLKVEILEEYEKKLKGIIHWVSKEHSMTATCNLYAVHFVVEDVKKAGDQWLDYINPDSLVVKNNVKLWNIHKNIPVDSRFQFERVGYFVLTEESNPKKGKYIFNRVVELKESKEKAVNIANAKK